MNPTRDSNINGVVSVKLLGMNFERRLSANETEFWADVVKTALRNYVQDRLQNRVRAVAERTGRKLTINRGNNNDELSLFNHRLRNDSSSRGDQRRLASLIKKVTCN
jgi:hypothetical protein